MRASGTIAGDIKAEVDSMAARFGWKDVLDIISEVMQGHSLSLISVHLLARVVEDHHSQELALLTSIQHDVTMLVQGPFRAGMGLLNDALQGYGSHGEGGENLRFARMKFVEAATQQTDLMDVATSTVYIGICWALEGDGRAACHYFIDAYRICDAGIQAACDEFQDDSNKRGQDVADFTLGAASVLFAYGIPIAFIRRNRRKRVSARNQAFALKVARYQDLLEPLGRVLWQAGMFPAWASGWSLGEDAGTMLLLKRGIIVQRITAG
jgi:hypothetical protein